MRIDAIACDVFLYGLLLLRVTSRPHEGHKLRDTRPLPNLRIVANHLLSGMRFPAYRPAKSIPSGTSHMRSLRCGYTPGLHCKRPIVKPTPAAFTCEKRHRCHVADHVAGMVVRSNARTNCRTALDRNRRTVRSESGMTRNNSQRHSLTGLAPLA